MSIRFKVNFARYANGETRISTPQWLNAENFRFACERAEDMLYTMKEIDPQSIFTIASIDAQYHGKECGGARMFETSEEFSARLAAEAE